MKFVFLSILVSIFFLPGAFSQSKPAKTGEAGTITLDKAEYDALNNQRAALSASNKSLKNDSALSSKSYADLKKKYKSDSTANAVKLKNADTTLIGKRSRYDRLKQETEALNKDLPFYEAEAKRVDRDSAAFAEKLRSAGDSIRAKSARIRQAGEIGKNTAALEKQLATLHASRKSLKDREDEQTNLSAGLTARLTHIEDSLAALNKTIGNLASVKTENARLKERVLGDFQKSVTTLTTGTDFSEQKRADLKAQSQRLSGPFGGNPAFTASNDKVNQFETLAIGIDKATDLLQHPYDPASCNAAIESLNKAVPLTPEQGAQVSKYKIALGNYCTLTHACDSAVQFGKKYTGSDPDQTKKILSGQLSKIDPLVYPFLYTEMQRLNTNGSKGISIEDSKIGHALCR